MGPRGDRYDPRPVGGVMGEGENDGGVGARDAGVVALDGGDNRVFDNDSCKWNGILRSMGNILVDGRIN